MKVSELIEALSQMPMDAPVTLIHANQGREEMGTVCGATMIECVRLTPGGSLYALFEITGQPVAERLQAVELLYETSD